MPSRFLGRFASLGMTNGGAFPEFENSGAALLQVSRAQATDARHRFGSGAAGAGAGAGPGIGIGTFAAIGFEGGRPRCTRSSIARSTGILTNPPGLSTHA